MHPATHVPPNDRGFGAVVAAHVTHAVIPFGCDLYATGQRDLAAAAAALAP